MLRIIKRCCLAAIDCYAYGASRYGYLMMGI
jgi:hypothetical protein